MELPPLKKLYAPRTLAFGALNGLVTLIPIHRAAAWQKAAICVAPGVVVAVLTPIVAARQFADEARAEQDTLKGTGQDPAEADPEDRALLRRRLMAAGVVVGGLGIGIMAAGLLIDRALENFLDRRGVRRPRAVMAVVATVVGIGTEYLDSGDDGSGDHDSGDHGPGDDAPGDRA